MRLEYKNYIIESDRNGFILTINGDIKNKKTGEITYGEIDQIYPVNLVNCFKRIREKEIGKLGKVKLETLVTELEKLDKDFLDNLEKILPKEI